MPVVKVVLAVQIVVAPLRVSHHLVRPLEERLVLYFIQDLVHWFTKNRIDPLVVRCALSGPVLPWPVVVLPGRPEIPPFLRDNLLLSLALLLILLNPFVLIDYPSIGVYWYQACASKTFLRDVRWGGLV